MVKNTQKNRCLIWRREKKNIVTNLLARLQKEGAGVPHSQQRTIRITNFLARKILIYNTLLEGILQNSIWIKKSSKFYSKSWFESDFIWILLNPHREYNSSHYANQDQGPSRRYGTRKQLDTAAYLFRCLPNFPYFSNSIIFLNN